MDAADGRFGKDCSENAGQIMEERNARSVQSGSTLHSAETRERFQRSWERAQLGVQRRIEQILSPAGDNTYHSHLRRDRLTSDIIGITCRVDFQKINRRFGRID